MESLAPHPGESKEAWRARISAVPGVVVHVNDNPDHRPIEPMIAVDARMPFDAVLRWLLSDDEDDEQASAVTAVTDQDQRR